MSYSEYFDMFKQAQEKECPFRAFAFDVVSSRTQPQYVYNKEQYFKFILYVYELLEKEEQIINKAILLKNQNNKKFSPIYKKDFNNNNYNPMVVGDLVTFFVYNNSISTERMLELFASALKKFDIKYGFHFCCGVYQTDNYSEGDAKLYKGYMPQILEKLSKKNNLIINSNFSNNFSQDKN